MGRCVGLFESSDRFAMKPKDQLQLKGKNHRGFSLIEVTIATGAIAFAAISILAIIPNGLTAATRSSQSTIAARLAAEVQSEIQQVGLASLPADTTYFDGEGKILPNSAEAVYEVYRHVDDCALPGAAMDNNFKKVIVQVVRNPARQTLLIDENSGLRIIPAYLEERTFQFHVLQ